MSGPRPVLFGEVLFDRFPGGEAVLGGAPFNVAWNLQALRLEPLFVSRVGDDDAGREILDAMRSWDMDTAGVQLDPEHATGAVEVQLEEGEPTYDILVDRAWDHIAADGLPPLPPEALLCHGTLALRAAESRDALEALTREARPRRLVDVNLRDPWWERDRVLALLEGAATIKLNEAELGLLTGATSETGASDELERAARDLLETCRAERIVVTRGERGTLALDRETGPLAGSPSHSVPVVDTVGAGDAFTSVLILGETRRWALETTLRRGLDFAEAVVGLRGATSTDPDFYTPFLESWSPA